MITPLRRVAAAASAAAAKEDGEAEPRAAHAIRPLRLVHQPSDMPERTPPPASASREDDPDDAELMAGVRQGSTRDFEAIVQRHWSRTALYAQHLVDDMDRAADVAQESFARLWQKRSEWQAGGSIRVWLLRTARNLVISEERRSNVRRRWIEGGAAEDASRPPTPLQEAERTELRAAIHQAVGGLSPRRREVFTLFHLQGLSYREVAQIMGIREQSVANHLQAAVAELRMSLSPYFPGVGRRGEGK